MALKGKTLIELTDVNTGEVETYEDENLVTSAIDSLFNDNLEGMLFYTQATTTINWNEYHLPICPHSIGGILLFSDKLEEDEGKIYAPSANPVVGYSSNNVNTNANPLRGSMNQAESGRIDGGYKFVFDFETSQGNGTISAVALTHKRGGVAAFGDTYNADNRLLGVKMVSTQPSGVRSNMYADAVEVDFDNNTLTSISVDTSGTIHIFKIRFCVTKVGLTFSLQDGGDDKLLEENTITPSTFISSDKNYPNVNFYDGKDGYYYGFMSNDNSSGNASIKWIKIKKEDYSFNEGTWTLNNVQLYRSGYRYNYGNSPFRLNYSTFCNGYVYYMAYNKQSVYKINVNNVADITKISLGFTSNFSGSSDSCYNYLYTIDDWVFGSDFRINSNDEVFRTVNQQVMTYCCTPFFKKGVYAITFGCYSYYQYYIYKRLWLICPYLATINNLGTAVIKTADKTMKITYTITENE